MSKLALKIVEAIQHSLLGSLLFALVWPTLWLFGQADKIGGARYFDGFFLAVGGLVLLVVFFAWLLGSVARGAQRPISAMDRLHKEAANGFDIWTCLPEGGLRPPLFTRRLVITLGRDPETKPSILGLPFFLGGIVLLILLDWISDRAWRDIHPWLGFPENRRVIAFVLAISFTVWWLHEWATRQRANLAPLP